jgi:alkaline phosphatase D
MQIFKSILFASGMSALMLVSGISVSPAQTPDPVSPYDFPYGYPFPDYPLAGASHPSVSIDYMRREPRPDRVKRMAQYALRLIQTDRVEEAVEYANRYMKDHPRLLDEEMLFMRAMALAQLGKLDEAAASMMETIHRAELPPQRFLAGPRRLFEPLHNHRDFASLLEAGQKDLVHGPMLGDMTHRSVKVWVRTVSEQPVRIAVSRSSFMTDPEITEAVMTRASWDYTAEITVHGLEPDTRYYYSVLLGPEQQEIRAAHQKFRTYPEPAKANRFQVAFGGCAGFVPFNERMWDTVRKFEPLAVFALGDNVYIDDPESPDQQQLMYYQRQSRPEFRRMTGSIPIYAIWDDHDFAMDDSEGGPGIDIPYWKPMVWDIFRQNWVNPEYASGDRPGGWFDFQLADVHFIFLDGRFYREHAGRWGDGERIENATMLGPHQKEWLRETLTGSEATFKVLISPVPWNNYSKGEGIRKLDGWYGYQEEREEIFSWINEHQVDGVLLLSSDRHRSDAWLNERNEGYDLYEFGSGHFTNQHTHPLIDGAFFGFNETNSFGLLTFDTGADVPQVTYEIVDIDGFIRERITVNHSQLRH